MVRIIRIVRNVKGLKSLRTMVFALINSFTSLLWAFAAWACMSSQLRETGCVLRHQTVAKSSVKIGQRDWPYQNMCLLAKMDVADFGLGRLRERRLCLKHRGLLGLLLDFLSTQNGGRGSLFRDKAMMASSFRELKAMCPAASAA